MCLPVTIGLVAHHTTSHAELVVARDVLDAVAVRTGASSTFSRRFRDVVVQTTPFVTSGYEC